MFAAALPAGAQNPNRVELPTEANAIAFAPGSQTIFYGIEGIELQLPGPVDDLEEVQVDLDTDGSMAGIRVTQKLTITGLGDFSFRVPGPAVDVQTLPESGTQPGLRRGAVLWQGFSSGEKVLAARMELYPDQESLRMPLRFALSITVDGQPLLPGTTASGELRMSLRVSNVSATPVEMAEATVDPAKIAPVLDRVRDLLSEGARPRPGEGGVPKSLPAVGPIGSAPTEIEAPFRVEGAVVFPPGVLSDVTANGAEVTEGSGGTTASFSGLLGGGDPLDLEVSLTGQAEDLGLPELEISDMTSVPSPRMVRPPAGGSWVGAVAAAPDYFDGREMLRTLLEVMWRVARIRQYDAYLGNPQPLGASVTSYEFRLAPPPAQAVAPPPVLPEGPAAATVVVASIAGVGLLFGLALLWSRF